MSKPSNGPASLSEAIDKLENYGQSKSHDFKEILEKDYEDLRKTLDSLKPHLAEFKTKVEENAKIAKIKVENTVKENPWYALGAVGFVAFFIGWLLGNNRK